MKMIVFSLTLRSHKHEILRFENIINRPWYEYDTRDSTQLVIKQQFKKNCQVLELFEIYTKIKVFGLIKSDFLLFNTAETCNLLPLSKKQALSENSIFYVFKSATIRSGFNFNRNRFLFDVVDDALVISLLFFFL